MVLQNTIRYKIVRLGDPVEAAGTGGIPSICLSVCHILTRCWDRCMQEIQLKQQALEAFRETLAVFNEHVGISEKALKRAPPHDLLRSFTRPSY